MTFGPGRRGTICRKETKFRLWFVFSSEGRNKSNVHPPSSPPPSTPSHSSFSSIQFLTSPFPTRKRPPKQQLEGNNNTKRRKEEGTKAEEEEVYTPCLFNLYMRLKNQESYKGSIKLLRNDYGGKPLFVLEPPPILPIMKRNTKDWMLAFTRFRPFVPSTPWGSVATSPRGASEALTGSPLPKPKLILAKDSERKHLTDCNLVDPTLQKVLRGESLDDQLFLLCRWSRGNQTIQTWERFDTLMRCETFLSPIQTFLCGGPSIQLCGPPLLIANCFHARPSKKDQGEETVLYFQLWDTLEKPALRECELISTFNGWLALEERVWKTSKLWEEGKSADELGCSVCGKAASESHDDCAEIYRSILEDYLAEETEETETEEEGKEKGQGEEDREGSESEREDREGSESEREEEGKER